MIEEIFVNLNAPSLATARVESESDSTSRAFAELVAGDTRNFKIFLVDGNGNFSPTSLYSNIKTTIGSSSIVYAENQTTLTIANGFQVEIPLDSQTISDGLDAGDIFTIFEVEVTDFSGNKRTIIQAPIQITGEVDVVSTGDDQIFKENFIVSVTNEVDDISIGSGKITFRVPFHFLVQDVRASLTQASSGSSVIVDINADGESILTTPISVDAGDLSSQTASVLPIISTALLSDDTEIKIDVDQVGTGASGKGLKVYLSGRRA